MKDTVTLKELVALVIRRGRICVTFALIFALLFGVIKMSLMISDMNDPSNEPVKVEERNEEKLDEYERKYSRLENKYQHKKSQLEVAIEYEKNSLLCKIDPSNMVVAQSILSVTNISKDVVVYRDTETNTVKESQELAILSHYDTLWTSADLQTVLKINSLDTYIREVVTLSIKDEILLKVEAVGSTEAEAKTLLDSTVKFLQSQTGTISEIYCSHDLIVLSSSVKVITDYESTEPAPLQKIQEKIIELKEELVKTEKELEQLTEPSVEQPIDIAKVIFKTVLQFIVGGIIGSIIGALYVIVRYLFGTRLTHITAAERQFPNCFALSLSSSKTRFEKMSNKLLGERIWENQTQAIAYLQQSLKVSLSEKDTIALVTSLVSVSKYEEIAQITKVLEQCGCKVIVADNAYYNPESILAVSQVDAVVMVEKYDESRTNEIEAILTILTERGKELESFVTI